MRGIGVRTPAMCLIPGIAVGLMTGWPVAALLAGLAGYFVPRIFGGGTGTHVAARSEAVAAWAEMLRDSLAAASGLEQAITVSAPVSPIAIRAEVTSLASRIDSGMPLGRALRMFSSDVDEPGADLVVASLVLASEHRAQRLGDLLGALAAASREEVAMRLRVEAGRAPIRTGIRVVTGFSVGFGVFLMLVARSYMAPFSSPGGEVALGVVGGFYAVGLALLFRMARPHEFPRIFAGIAEELP